MKERDCIVYLLRGNEASIRQFRRSARLLRENFLPWSPADVIVFHERNFDPAAVSGILPGVEMNFALVDFSSVPPELAAVEPSQRGYRHMCHFFANDIFAREELAGYRYEMRMDDDSFILSPVRFNVFGEMEKGGCRYGYRAVISDKEPFCRGLWPAAERYFAEHGSMRAFKDMKTLSMYYTNFEICELKWFRGEAWQGFFRAIDETGGIWRDRWGDAPIRYLGVNGLLPDSAIRQFTEIHYRHQSEWRAGKSGRTAFDMAKYYLWVMARMVETRVAGLKAACGRGRRAGA